MFLLHFIGGRSQSSRSACLICSSRRSLISIPPHSANQLTKKLPCLSWLPLSPICSCAISPLNGRLSRVTPTRPPTHPKKSSTVFILPSESLKCCKSLPCDFRDHGIVGGIGRGGRSLLALIKDQKDQFFGVFPLGCLHRGGRGKVPQGWLQLGTTRTSACELGCPALTICKQVQVATRARDVGMRKGLQENCCCFILRIQGRAASVCRQGMFLQFLSMHDASVVNVQVLEQAFYCPDL